MVINWHGEGNFKLQSGTTTLLVDPTTNRFKGDVTLLTKTEVLPFPLSEAGLIAGPGEYEAKGIEVLGMHALGTTVYRVQFENITLCFCGHLAGDIDADALEKLAGVDILFIPGSGAPFVTLETVAKIVKKIEPQIVIPSFIKDAKKFLKEVEYASETTDKLTLKKKDLEGNKTRVIILKA